MAMDSKSKKAKLAEMRMPRKGEENSKELELELEFPASDEVDEQEENPASEMGDEELLSPEEMKDAEENESPEDELAESPEYQKKEEELGVEKHPDAMEKFSDDELMAELKRRGLSKGMAGSGEDEEDEYVLRA